MENYTRAIEKHFALLPGVPLIRSPFFSEIFGDDYPIKAIAELAHKLNTDGYAVIDFPDDNFDARSQSIIKNLGEKFDLSNWLRLPVKNKPSLRVQDAWKFDQNVRSLATNSIVMQALQYLYGRRPIPFQTLNFPVGTQQHPHTDHVHFSSIPKYFMCGVWVALEDVTIDSGPLLYYPGSHKWECYDNEHVLMSPDDVENYTQPKYEPLWNELITSYQAQKKVFTCKKGEALIWDANLLHGGEALLSGQRTRWSQVTHYFFSDCMYYTPMHTQSLSGKIRFRNIEEIEAAAE